MLFSNDSASPYTVDQALLKHKAKSALAVVVNSRILLRSRQGVPMRKELLGHGQGKDTIVLSEIRK